ncbi:MAG: YedE-related selenium metabolism membrane protein [Pirellulales bacterium]|nr:YedE-related selenium metabolism membrane protein [Pirellulales bacterium]
MKSNWKTPAPPAVIVAGAVLGAFGALLAWAGNPPNMGLCIACFERDIAGALGLHREAVVQYLRPEIPALILGVALAAVLAGEWKGRSAAAPAVSFLLGGLMMLGALVFLGCPVRMTLRLGGGDWTALGGLAGFVLGIGIGTSFLRRGYSLGRAIAASYATTVVLPFLAVGLLTLLLFRPTFLFFSAKGPGSQAVPLGVALGAALLIGVLAQRSRLCFAGGIRDLLLIRSPHLLVGLAAALVIAFVTNLALGQFRPGFTGQPIAHSNHLWSFLSMALVGLSAVLLGGCPLRQLVLAGQGDGGAFCALAGMFVGAALAHNFGLAASPAGVPVTGQVAVAGGLAICLIVGWFLREP